MSRNIEIKACLESIDNIIAFVVSVTNEEGLEMEQDDTFFRCDNGRLKLRQLTPDRGELIFYQRPDQAGPKVSEYFISETTEPEGLRKLLSSAYGEIGRIRKTRRLYHIGRIRIHLDTVDGLGEFIELEVVMNENEPVDNGIREANELMHSLGIDDCSLIEGAYIDLLRK